MEKQRAIELSSLIKSILQARFGVPFLVEDTLGCPVDLVTEKALRPELCLYIEREKILV